MATMSYAERRAGFRKYFDRRGKRLVYVGASADAEFWDDRWSDLGAVVYGETPNRRSLVVRETTRWLDSGSVVLEGGCGLAVDSWHLHLLGYRTLALDYAQRTLARVVAEVPQVGPLAGDVTRLPLPTASVDGYWSLGVIEHFFDGYQGIRDEMVRVIRPGGFLFLTFPVFSGLRRLKAALGLYPRWQSSDELLARFYQFALSSGDVTRDFEGVGFELVHAAPALGVSGMCEELGAVGRWLNRRLSAKARPVRLVRAALDFVLRRFSGHIRLLVLKRSDD